MKPQKHNLSQRLNRKKRQKWLIFALIIFCCAIALKIAFNLIYLLPQNTMRSPDVIFVLGGSIQRENYAAKLANLYPDLPILISKGSHAPCVYQIFLKLQSRMNNVCLETCANSTFGNFFFGVPIIRHWGAHKVMLITSPTHLPRAQWMAQIQLGTQGIAVEIKLTNEPGIPGNQESKLKTALDITRSILWSGFAQLISPPCFDVTELIKFNSQDWQNKPYQCEYRPRY
jgi:uncharacterized SAM-binding protein YcdF (DUF218 family)